MKQILIDVLNRMAANVPLLKHIDEDWGQLDFYGNESPVKYPCGLIDIASGTFSNEGKLIQLGLLQVKIRLADLRLSNSSSKAPQNQKDKSFSFFDLVQSVHLALHGFSGDASYSQLIRTTFAKVKRSDGLRLYEMIYTTEWTDASTKPVQATTAAPTVAFNVSTIKA